MSDTRGFEAFDEVKRAIVVTGHADDMETIMGGTAARLIERGAEMFVLICTLGDIGANHEAETREGLAARRIEEARAAAESLGFREAVTLDRHDGELVPDLKLRADIVSYYRRWQADTLFTFDPWWDGQVHADHAAAGRAAVDAVMPSGQRLYHPEQLQGAGVGAIRRIFLFSSASPDVSVDVTPVYGRKVAASVLHMSQFPEGEKNLDWMRRLDEIAAKTAGLDATYVERFRELRRW